MCVVAVKKSSAFGGLINVRLLSVIAATGHAPNVAVGLKDQGLPIEVHANLLRATFAEVIPEERSRQASVILAPSILNLF
jgi:D-ribose pyranose/furanose isomerase RbsD